MERIADGAIAERWDVVTAKWYDDDDYHYYIMIMMMIFGYLDQHLQYHGHKHPSGGLSVPTF